jgi:hypothetical protein
MVRSKTMKVNFSGHPVAGFDVAPFVGANLPTDAAALAATVRETVLALPEREKLLQGAPVEVILPGLAHAAACVLAGQHALHQDGEAADVGQPLERRPVERRVEGRREPLESGG